MLIPLIAGSISLEAYDTNMTWKRISAIGIFLASNLNCVVWITVGVERVLVYKKLALIRRLEKSKVISI